ncbi:MAG: PfkB family carbohydrate kinase [Anaerolineales bacterium]
MLAGRTIDYLAIGHVAKDLTPQGARLGGTVAFAALTARALDYTSAVVTAHGEELDLSPLAGIPVERVPSPTSTTFENIYGPHGRRQFLRARAVPLTLESTPTDWRRAPIVHLAPLARELDPNLAAAFPNSFVGLTPQGWLRTWDAEGRVSQDDWPEAFAALPHASATVISIEDVRGDWSLVERWARPLGVSRVLAVTEGAQGSTIFAQGEGPRRFPARPQTEADPTGAGDIFAAAFFIHLYETGDPWASARFANEVAALSVTRVGLEGVPTPEEIGLCRIRAM